MRTAALAVATYQPDDQRRPGPANLKAVSIITKNLTGCLG